METNIGPSTKAVPSTKVIALELANNKANAGLAWKYLLDQDVYWVPKGAWSDYTNSFTNTSKSDVFAGVESKVEISSMSETYLTSLLSFLTERSLYICQSLSFVDQLACVYAEANDEDYPASIVSFNRKNVFELTRDKVSRQAWMESTALYQRLQIRLGLIPDPEIEKQRRIDAVNAKITKRDVDSYDGYLTLDGVWTHVQNGIRDVKLKQPLVDGGISVEQLAAFIEECKTSTGILDGKVTVEGEVDDYYTPSYSIRYEVGQRWLEFNGQRAVNDEERALIQEDILKERTRDIRFGK